VLDQTDNNEKATAEATAMKTSPEANQLQTKPEAQHKRQLLVIRASCVPRGGHRQQDFFEGRKVQPTSLINHLLNGDDSSSHTHIHHPKLGSPKRF